MIQPLHPFVIPFWRSVAPSSRPLDVVLRLETPANISKKREHLHSGKPEEKQPLPMAFVSPDDRCTGWGINTTISSVVAGPHREQDFSIELMEFLLPESIFVHDVPSMQLCGNTASHVFECFTNRNLVWWKLLWQTLAYPG